MKKSFPLDLSAIIHLASMTEKHSSSYRFAVSLTENVNPEVLQQAVERVTPRFPMIAAGIHSDFYNYKVAAVEKSPKVLRDHTLIATFTKEELQKCAMRVLYDEKKISLECFHALTDGYGAITFLRTLLAEYFQILKGISVPRDQMLFTVDEEAKGEEIQDDYYTHAQKGTKATSGKISYQLPKGSKSEIIKPYVCSYKIKDLLEAARRYNVSLNIFLTAIMIMSVAELQKEENGKMPVQVMVPMNLRNLFPSKTLRNFILVAYTGLKYEECHYTFEKVLAIVKEQLKHQMEKERLQATMNGYASLERNWFLKMVPLSIKTWAVKLGHYFFGLRKSCITVTNLGPIVFPEEIAPYVECVNVFLTPREASGYNCGIITCGDQCYINFTRLHESPILEEKFKTMLKKYM